MACSRIYACYYALRLCNGLNNCLKLNKSVLHNPCSRNVARLSTCTGVRLLCDINPICWKCGSRTLLSDVLCPKCKVLQNPSQGSNYFQIFGLHPSYDLSISDLSKEHRRLQSILHPDKYANSDEKERAISDEYSSLVNKAYSTLQKPLSRGLYLLELEGICLEEGAIQSDPKFLMDIMERNEEIDEANTETEIKVVIDKNQKILHELENEISIAFRSRDFVKAMNTLIKMKYFSSIEEKIKILKEKKGYID